MKRSKFSLSNTKLFSTDMGNLTPIGLTEVLPGDSVQQSTSLLVRVSPLLTPVMHPVTVRVHHWYVPHRLVWVDFEEFITGGPNGTSTPTFPTISFTNPAEKSLADYLGITPGTGTISVNALPFRGMAMIFNEWYRDQDLVNALAYSTASGVDSTTNVNLQNVAWEKDYFTTARTTEQKGGSVTLPLGTTAPVERTGTGAGDRPQMYSPSDSDKDLYANIGSYINLAGGISTAGSLQWGSQTGLQTDLSSAVGPTVTAFREAMAINRYRENRLRYGSRYSEYLLALGIKGSDARLNRPEYLGGGKQTIQFSEVLQSGTGGTYGVGSLYGHGIAALRSNRYRKFFEEHGYIFTCLSVVPKTIYSDGLDKHWIKSSKEDFWQRELQHIGMEAIQNREVDTYHGTPAGTFGYQDRYQDYRAGSKSGIAGEFRSTLNTWHYARMYGSTPALNNTFVTCTPTKRVNADSTNNVLWCMANHSIQARRLVSQQGTPLGA